MIKIRSKQTLFFSLCLCFGIAFMPNIIGSTVFAQAQENRDEQKIAIAEGSVAKMKEPSNSAESLGHLAKGDVVVLVEESTLEYGWLEATMNDQKFFVPTNQMKVVSTQETFSEPMRARIKADGVNLRSKPNVDAQIVCLLKKGTPVDVTQKIGNWYKITSGKTFGYVNCEYIDMAQGETEPVYLTLSMGMSGIEVKKLQETLAAKGYIIDNINGAYGAKTRDAVKQFQKENNIQADGIARIEMQVLLYQDGSDK